MSASDMMRHNYFCYLGTKTPPIDELKVAHMKGGVVVFLCAIALVTASPGDDLDEFQDCVRECIGSRCWNNDHTQFTENPLTPWLEMFLWDCESNCDYQCQQIVTEIRKTRNDEIFQFHGKWPFIRVWGVQELFSTVFSMLNFIPHYLGCRKVYREFRSPKGTDWLYFNALMLTVVTQLAWIASTLFHIRDFLITERFDYFMAGATVLTGFHTIGSRVLRLYLPRNWLYRYSFGFLCISLYIGHLRRLLTDWSYTYNMQANIFIGILQNVAWFLLTLVLYVTKSGQKFLHTPTTTLLPLTDFFARSPRNYALVPAILNIVIILGMSLEIFDFAPWWDLIDAHSLWHLVTIFPAFYWYDWQIWDIKENVAPQLTLKKE